MLNFLHDICSLPTAPFHESAVLEYARRFAAERPRIKLASDRFGNLMLSLPARRRGPRLVFVAHADHPGFIARRMIDDHHLEADFRGGVYSTYLPRTPVRFFDGDRQIKGQVLEVTQPASDRKDFPGRVRIRVSESVAANSVGMFDQGEGRIKKGKFYCRGIDDTGGVAAALAMLDQLHLRPPAAGVALLITRAEEEGFIGAIAAVLKPRLLRRSDRIISIECSAMQPYALQGNGVIIRVGDRTSVFNSALTHFLTSQAERLAKSDKSFRHQRCLMPGGTCEATVFDAYGYTAAAACVPLGNYHNMDRDAERIGPEYIDVADWQNMVRLFEQIARNAHEFSPEMRPLKQRLQKRFDSLRAHLERQ